jgi:hypothetical protein
VDHILENEFSHNVRASMYRAWAYPESYPNEPQPVLKNWPQEDLEDYGIKPCEVDGSHNRQWGCKHRGYMTFQEALDDADKRKKVAAN